MEFFLDAGGALRHADSIVIKQLCREGTFFVTREEALLLIVFLMGVVECVDKFGDGISRTKPAGKQAKRCIRDAIHRRQDQPPMDGNVRYEEVSLCQNRNLNL